MFRFYVNKKKEKEKITGEKMWIERNEQKRKKGNRNEKDKIKRRNETEKKETKGRRRRN